MADKEITIKVSTTADTQEVDDLKQMLEAMENTNVKLEFDADKTPIDEAKESTEDLQSAFEEATNTVDELTQELADIEMGISDADFDTVNEALTEATERADELGSALADLDSSRLQEAGDNAQSFADSTDQAKTSMDDLNDSMGLIESTMLMDMANQIGALGDQAEGMAQEMNTASISVGQLSTNVGMAEPQMVSLINYISNATFPQEEAIAYVNVLNQMGVSADKLGDSATNMDRINDATGMGSDKVMLLTQGLQSLGVTADNLPSAFNAIAYAEANVGGGAETLQQVLRRQAGTLNEYGMGVDATVVALSALQRETGLTGMKLGSEFGSRLKECNGDLSALEQSLGLQAGALSNASSETDKYTGKLQELANEEAEHKTFIDQINAGWEDMQLALAPVLSPLMSFVGLIGSFGQTALAVNSLITLGETFGFLTVTEEGLTIAQWTLNASMLANPALWLAIAIIALIGILIYLYYTNEDVRNAVNNLGQTFIWIGQVIYGALVGTIQWLMGLFNDFTAQMGLNTSDWIQAVLGFIMFMPQLPLRVGQLLLDTLAKALGFGDNFTQTMYNSAVNAVMGFVNSIKGLYNGLKAEFDRMVDMVMNHPLVQTIIWLGQQISSVFSHDGLNQRSPGDVYKALKRELDWSEDLVEDSDLPNLMGKMGNNIASSFSNSQLNNTGNGLNGNSFANEELSSLAGILNNQNTNDTYIFNLYGDMDNEERMRKFIDAVKKDLHWDNKTAGRTI